MDDRTKVRVVALLRPTVYDGAFTASLVRSPFVPLLHAYAAVDDGQSFALVRANVTARRMTTSSSLLVDRGAHGARGGERHALRAGGRMTLRTAASRRAFWR